MHYKKLTVVSDTALYKLDGIWYGFNAVVNEIKLIEDRFDTITWIGFNRNDLMDSPTLIPVNSDKINIIALNAVGGKGILHMSKIIVNYPLFLFTILKHIWNAQVVHTRAPSHPAFVAILVSFLFQKKIWWHKFAGSWDASTLPFFYKVQRNVLIEAKHTNVTINGFWHNQPTHCHSFENPCLTEQHISDGIISAKAKTFEPPFVFAFIGRLEDAKGVSELIDALQSIPIEKIKEVHFIGDGNQVEAYKHRTQFLSEKVFYHGFLESEKVHVILKDAHFFLLPSKSEGFPKVIAEAACYGVIPVVSNVGSISHYIHNNNGFIWKRDTNESYSEVLNAAVSSDAGVLKNKSKEVIEVAKKFTYPKYLKKLDTILYKR